MEYALILAWCTSCSTVWGLRCLILDILRQVCLEWKWKEFHVLTTLIQSTYCRWGLFYLLRLGCHFICTCIVTRQTFLFCFYSVISQSVVFPGLYFLHVSVMKLNHTKTQRAFGLCDLFDSFSNLKVFHNYKVAPRFLSPSKGFWIIVLGNIMYYPTFADACAALKTAPHQKINDFSACSLISRNENAISWVKREFTWWNVSVTVIQSCAVRCTSPTHAQRRFDEAAVFVNCVIATAYSKHPFAG